MKALMKGNAKAYFAKKQKAKEDTDQIMNRIQATAIAKVIGISEHQINSDYAVFFQLIHKTKLPKGFKRYLNSQSTKVIYFDEINQEEYMEHPNIDNFKVAFYEIIKNDKTVHTFDSKSRKLLPFVEQKLVRQCFGLASKRRDAQKANIQKDQNGKVMISKLARLRPDVRSLISSRSYMLKNLVEKIYTKKQIWGKGKRANTFAQILAQYNKQRPNMEVIDEDQIQTEHSLEVYQKIFQQSKYYYFKKFGNLDYIPKELMVTKQFIKSTPDSVFRNLNFLNIDKESIELYWLARLMESLPLPSNWTRKQGKSFEEFLYEPEKILFQLHPSYLYIIQNMNRFKGVFSNMDAAQQNYYTTMRQMIFFDYFERPYHVDWFAYMTTVDEGKITRKKMIKKVDELKTNDWMAIEALVNSGMQQREYPMLELLMNYWGTLNYQEQSYIPAISPFGEIIWSSRLNQKAIHFCPHIEQLQNLRNQTLKYLPQIDRTKDLKKYEFEQQQLKLLEYSLLYQVFPEEREKFIKYYLVNDPKPLSQPYQHPQNFDRQTFYDIIFTSQFDLLSQIPLNRNENNETVVPLWLEKCYAKQKSNKHYAILSNFHEKFSNIKKVITKQAIQQARVHEPGSQEQLYRMLEEQVTNIKQLKKFVKYINDVDARQQRKKMANMGMNNDEEKDLLGSSLSQIDVEQLVQNQQSEQEQQQSQESSEAQEPEISDSSSQQEVIEQFKQPSQHQQIVSDDQSIKFSQKYDGIKYSQISQMDEMKEQTLDVMLIQQKKSKMLKHKYSSQAIRERISSIDLRDPQNSVDVKKNLIISQLRSYHSPYNTSPNKLRIKKRRRSSQLDFFTHNGVPDITEQFSIFQSEASDYADFNQEMHEFIEEYKRNRAENERPQTQVSQITDYGQKKRVIDDTRETIQLQPILRIKPDISKDPTLEHISNFYKAGQFRKCFGQSSPIKIAHHNHRKSLTPTKITKSNSNSSLSKKLFQNETAQRNDLFLESKLKLSGKKQLFQSQKLKYLNPEYSTNHSKKNILKSSSLVGINTFESLNKNTFGGLAAGNYNRVCLGNTASALLPSEPLSRRGDLIVLEAQKQLLHKGRGLQTKIIRNY